MSRDQAVHKRRSVRLKVYDYAQPGYAFVTICTDRRVSVLGAVDAGAVRLNPSGTAAHVTWLRIPEWFPSVKLDEYVVMPNHVHGILVFGEETGEDEGAMNRAPTDGSSRYRGPGVSSGGPVLGQVVRAFKAASARAIRTSVDPGFGWQRNYYERVIRNDRELDAIRSYIVDNPRNWAEDVENTSNPMCRR